MDDALETDILRIDIALVGGGASYGGTDPTIRNLDQVLANTTVGRVNQEIVSSTILSNYISGFFSRNGVFLFNSTLNGIVPSAGTGEFLPVGAEFPNGTTVRSPTIVLNIPQKILDDTVPNIVDNPFATLPGQPLTSLQYPGPGEITGVLSHELGHFADQYGELVGVSGASLGLPTNEIYDPSGDSSIGDFVGLGLIKEGRAIYNNFVVADQLAVSSKGDIQITDLPLSSTEEASALGLSPLSAQEAFASDTALVLESDLSDPTPHKYLYKLMTQFGFTESVASYITAQTTKVDVLTSYDPSDPNYVTGIVLDGDFSPIQQVLVGADLALSSFAVKVRSYGSNIPLTLDNSAGGSQLIYTDPGTEVASVPVIDVIKSYAGPNGTGALIEQDSETASSSLIISIEGAPQSPSETITTYYSEPDAEGAATVGSTKYQVQPGDTYNSIAAALRISGVTGAILAMMNNAEGGSVAPAGSQIYVPTGVGTSQAFTAGGAAVSVSGPAILNLDADTITPLDVGGTDNTPGIYVSDNNGDLIDLIDDYGNANPIQFSALTVQDAVDNSSGVDTFPIRVAVLVSGDLINRAYVANATGTFYPPQSLQLKSGVFGLQDAPALPYFGLTGGTSITEADSFPNVAPTASLASFNSSSGTPDFAWNVGVDSQGNAVITGDAGSGYNGTVTLTQGQSQTLIASNGNSYIYDLPDITSVRLDQTYYALEVLPSGGTVNFNYGYDTADTFGGVIVAEGAGTNTIDFESVSTNYWHVSGYGDTATLNNSATEIYLLGGETDYQYAWNGNGTLTMTGGSTGATTFKIGTGEGEINFSDGSAIDLGSNYPTGFEDSVMYGSTQGGNNFFLLDGGDQTIYGADGLGQVDFTAGSDDPLDWTIAETQAAGQPIMVTFDGTDAGYDGLAVLSGVSQVSLNDIFYTLDSLAPGGIETISSGPNLVVDGGGATLTFDDTGSTTPDYWFVGGAGDQATLASSPYSQTNTEIYLAAGESAYILSYDTLGNLLIAGGSTGTTTIDLAGGTGELNFGDGSVIGLGDVGDDVQYGGASDDTFALSGGDTYTNGGGGFNTVNLSGSAYIASVGQAPVTSEDGEGDAVLDGTNTGYAGSATLANIQQVSLGYLAYDLVTLARAGNATVTVAPAAGDYSQGAIVAEGNGGNTVTLDEGAGTTSYWDINGADDTAILRSGNVDLILSGAPSDYSTSYDAEGDLIVADAVDPLTVIDDGGTGEIVFADGTTFDVGATIPCYRSGTRLRSSRGYIEVENLCVGDELILVSGGAAPVVWMGNRWVDCAGHPHPDRIWPVCVTVDAFSPGVPQCDLFLSPDHAIMIDGVLIPVKQLINGGTIVQVPVSEVTYWHIELEHHDVVLAEGLPAETYLDTGNRAMFANGGTALTLHPDFAIADTGLRCRERNACAPMARVDQAKPVWEQLAARALTLGYAMPARSITVEPQLRLEARGRALLHLPGDHGWHVFVFPACTDGLHLVSRAGVPSDVQPWLEDRRRLGVSVVRIRANVGNDLIEIPVDHPALGVGWHNVEREEERLWRWTDGRALLPVPVGTTMLQVQLAGSAEYLLPAAASSAALAA